MTIAPSQVSPAVTAALAIVVDLRRQYAAMQTDAARAVAQATATGDSTLQAAARSHLRAVSDDRNRLENVVAQLNAAANEAVRRGILSPVVARQSGLGEPVSLSTVAIVAILGIAVVSGIVILIRSLQNNYLRHRQNMTRIQADIEARTRFVDQNPGTPPPPLPTSTEQDSPGWIESVGRAVGNAAAGAAGGIGTLLVLGVAAYFVLNSRKNRRAA